MVIPVHNSFLRVIVLLLGICPLWAFAAGLIEVPVEGQNGEQKSYGPVGSTDTLADIAIKLRGDGPWHYQRWMYALYRKNPQAFFGANMNNIKLGAILMLPTEGELKQIDLAEAFRAVKVQLYVLEQNRQERRESDEELLLRARVHRLYASNEMMRQQSGELFNRISSLEQEMGSVVDRILESEDRGRAGAVQAAERETPADSHQPTAATAFVSTSDEESENSTTWWFILLSVALVYSAGFFWRRHVEAAL